MVNVIIKTANKHEQEKKQGKKSTLLFIRRDLMEQICL